MKFLLLFALADSAFTFIVFPRVYPKAYDKIRADGFSVEIHHVTTPDGYVLELHRIKSSPRNQSTNRPVAYMNHGLSGSSGDFVLADREQAIAYLAADAGYDVWLGNNRGNYYSRKNIYLEPTKNMFWNFSWYEIATIDLPTIIDYVLETTNQNRLHYFGVSQGTTIYLTLLSEKPEYNSKITTGHLFAPVAFWGNIKDPNSKQLGETYGGPNPDRETTTSYETAQRNEVAGLILAFLCSQPWLVDMCLTQIGTGQNSYTNTSLLPQVFASTPSGASFVQNVHYAQLIKTGKFREFDWGENSNMEKYGTPEPPDFKLEKIEAPTFIYYSNGDPLSSEVDVEHLISILGPKTVVGTWYKDDMKWDHGDYGEAKNLKEELNDFAIANMNKYQYPGN